MAEDQEVEVPTKEEVKQMMADLGDEVTLPEGVTIDEPAAKQDELPLQDDKSAATSAKVDSTEGSDESQDDSDGTQEVSQLAESEEIIRELTGGDEAEAEDDSSEADDEALLKDASEETIKAFKDMRLKIKDLNSRLETNDDSDKVKALQDQVSQLQGRLGAIDLAQSPQFRQRYDLPIAKEIGTLKKIVSDAGGEPQILAQALRFNNMVERKRFLTEELPLVANELSIMMTRLDTLRSDRNIALKDFMGTKKSMVVQETAKRTDMINGAFDKNVDLLAQSGHFLYRASKSENANEWNEGVTARRESARKIAMDLATSDNDTLASVALKAAVADDLLKLYVNERKARMDLEKASGIQRSVKPNVGAGAKKPAKKSAPSDRGPMTGEDIADLIAARDYGQGALT